tara:strand:+ start:349 stop:1014 length:666 start_codon:yes stop_codon:yes gene_type:complete
MLNSTFITDSELVGWINIALAELHDILVTTYEDYYVSTEDYSLPADNPGTLPDSFYKAIGVDLSMSGSFEGSNVVYRMRPYSFQERAAYSNPLMTASRSTSTFYNIRGNEIHFIPNPTVGAAVRLYYVPEASYFSEAAIQPGDTIGDVAPRVAIGWEEYIINDVCMKIVMKEEGDPTGFASLKNAQRKRLETVAQIKDPGESKAITDVSIGTLGSNYVNWM